MNVATKLDSTVNKCIALCQEFLYRHLSYHGSGGEEKVKDQWWTVLITGSYRISIAHRVRASYIALSAYQNANCKEQLTLTLASETTVLIIFHQCFNYKIGGLAKLHFTC